MAWMIRKQIYIEPAQEANLKEQAKSLGLAEAEVIRRAINRQMTFPVSGLRNLSAWEKEKAFTSILQKFRRLQIRGVQDEAVYSYRESWRTKEMRPPKLSRRVKIDRYFFRG